MADGSVCASTVTHARPPATVIACGLPPTAIVAIGWLVAGSIRVTVPSPLLATHTEPAPTDTPVGERPTAIVSVTALVPGSIRTTLSAPLTATQTPPPPTAIPLGPGPTASGVTRPVALSTRITLPAKLSVIHAAPAPTSIPPGAALGSTCSTMRPVCAASRVNSPECGATQTWSFRAATAPGLPGTTVPIVTFWPIRSNCGSMRRAETDGAVALETTTHTPPAAAAIPVGGPPAGIARSGAKRLGVHARDRLVVEVCDPQRPGPERDRARSRADRDLPDDAVGIGVDRGQRVGRHPHGAARARARQSHRRCDQHREQHRCTGSDHEPTAPRPTSGRAQLSSGIPGRRVERRILGQNRSLELLKLATGLEPELVDQPTPGDAIALKRVGLAPRSV